MADITLQDVQSLLDIRETNANLRHGDLVSRLNRLDDKVVNTGHRIRELELSFAENKPIIRGIKGATAMMAAALLAGYVGSYFGS